MLHRLIDLIDHFAYCKIDDSNMFQTSLDSSNKKTSWPSQRWTGSPVSGDSIMTGCEAASWEVQRFVKHMIV